MQEIVDRINVLYEELKEGLQSGKIEKTGYIMSLLGCEDESDTDIMKSSVVVMGDPSIISGTLAKAIEKDQQLLEILVIGILRSKDGSERLMEILMKSLSETSSSSSLSENINIPKSNFGSNNNSNNFN